jgi:hypothetical protein
MAPVVNTEVYEYRRTIRVTFPDGSMGEAEERIPLHGVQQLPDRRTIDCRPRLSSGPGLGRSCRSGTTNGIIHTSCWTSRRSSRRSSVTWIDLSADSG